MTKRQSPEESLSASQIALPLERADRGWADRIVVGSANIEAIEALRAPERWPYHSAILTGPQRSGKSLIGRWAQSRGIDVIDDADERGETELFHRWNDRQSGGSSAGVPLLMIASRRPWEITLPDLRSRLGGSLQLEIGEPDDRMAGELIEALAAQRGLTLAPGAADYLVPRAERGQAALEQLVLAIDRISLERQVPATLSIWRAALESLQGPEQADFF